MVENGFFWECVPVFFPASFVGDDADDLAHTVPAPVHLLVPLPLSASLDFCRLRRWAVDGWREGQLPQSVQWMVSFPMSINQWGFPFPPTPPLTTCFFFPSPVSIFFFFLVGHCAQLHLGLLSGDTASGWSQLPQWSKEIDQLRCEFDELKMQHVRSSVWGSEAWNSILLDVNRLWVVHIFSFPPSIALAPPRLHGVHVRLLTLCLPRSVLPLSLVGSPSCPSSRTRVCRTRSRTSCWCGRAATPTCPTARACTSWPLFLSSSWSKRTPCAFVCFPLDVVVYPPTLFFR